MYHYCGRKTGHYMGALSGERVHCRPLTDICRTMDSTVLHSDANLPPHALLHHIATHCRFFLPILCCVLPKRVSCVVFSSVPTRLLCFVSTCLLCCVMHLFGLYVSVVRRSAPVVLLCSASTCLLSCPGLWQVTLPELSYHGCCSRPHPHQLNLFKFTNMCITSWKVTAVRKGGLAMQKFEITCNEVIFNSEVQCHKSATKTSLETSLN